MSEWVYTTLAHVGKWHSGGTPSTTEPLYWDGEIPWISASSMHDFAIIDSERRVTQLGVENGTRIVPENTIIFVVRGMSLQTEFRIGITKRPVTFGQDCKAIIPSEQFCPLFLAYFLKSQQYEVLGLVDEASHGTGKLPTESISQLDVPIPPLPEQRAIAGVLSSLDDKIDLLHRQNKTLEALAETLFRKWFIEDASDDWTLGKLGDLIELHYGKGLKETERSGQGYPVIGSSGIVGWHSEALVAGPGIVIGRKGTIGKVIYLYDDFFPIDTTFFVRSKTAPGSGLHFENYLLRTIEFENSDSAVPGLNREIALSVTLKIPPSSIVAQFNEWFGPFATKQRSNEFQIKTLEALRNSLLPKLMSGEVRVKYE